MCRPRESPGLEKVGALFGYACSHNALYQLRRLPVFLLTVLLTMGTRRIRGLSTGVAGNRHMQPGIIARGPELTEVKGKKCMASTFLQSAQPATFDATLARASPSPW